MKFDVHPAVAMVKKWVVELPVKTGRSLEQWRDIYITKERTYPVRKDLVMFIKNEYGLGTVTAEQIWEFAFGQQTWEGDDASYLKNANNYYECQYAGAKEHFTPLFDVIYEYVKGFGKDVKVCPCKTMIPFYRGRVFAETRPATKTRFELAMALGATPFLKDLKSNPRAKGNDRLRHIVYMETARDFNSQVKKWLKTAYQMAEKK